MPSELAFVIDFRPQPKQRTSNAVVGGRVKRYTPEETRIFEAQVGQLAWVVMTQKKIKRCDSGPVSLLLHFYFEVPKSLSILKYAERLGTAHTLKPDLTNLTKAIEDGCNNIVYRDDAQIASLSVMKTWSTETKVHVTFSW